MKKNKYGNYEVRWKSGSRKRSKTFKRKEQALNFQRDIILGKADTQKESSMTFDEFSDYFVENHVKVLKSKTQWPNDTGTIKNHLSPAFGSVKIKDLSQHHLLSMRTKLVKAKKIRPKTINNIVSLARTMMTCAVEWEFVKSNPFARLKPLSVGEQRFDYWIPEERDRFLNYCKAHDPQFWQVVTIACHTGMRLGEIQGLKRGDIDLGQKKILVTGQYNHKLKEDIETTKSKKLRQIPMNGTVYQILREKKMMAMEARVFPENLKYAARKLQAIAKRAQVKEITFHDLRHTFASCLAMAGIPIQTIQALLGHSTIQQTMRYAHLHPSHLKGVTDILESGRDLDGQLTQSM